MSSYLPIVAGQQIVDANGQPIVGARATIMAASSDSLVPTFSDNGLTETTTNPLIADSNGRFPFFFCEDGLFRVRVTDAAGTPQYDYQIVAAVQLPTDEDPGDEIDATAMFGTGDTKWRLDGGVLGGWVRVNGRTIGSAASGASERANDDCEDLFTYYWNNFSDTLCPVVGGRGANAAADWAADKRITQPDARSRTFFGVDDMGNSAAGRLLAGNISLGSVTTGGSSGGAANVALTEAQLASHLHGLGTLATVAVSAHEHTTPASDGLNTDRPNSLASGGGSNPYTFDNGQANGAHSHTFTGALATTGSGETHNNMPPFLLGTLYIRL